jgi:hypothetical protein
MLTDESTEADYNLYERVWAASRPGKHHELAANDVQDVVSEGMYPRYLGREKPPHLDDLRIHPDEFERKLAHFRQKSYLFMMGADPVKPWKVRPGTIGRAMRKRVGSESRAWGRVEPVRKTLDVLVRRRRALLDSVWVAQVVVDQQGNPYQPPSEQELPGLMDAVAREWFPSAVGPWFDRVRKRDDVRQEALRRHAPPPRYGILGSEASLGTVWGQRAVAGALGWLAFLYK